MKTTRRALAMAAAALCTVHLGGCVTVFPKSPQVTLYRLEAGPPLERSPTGPSEVTTVALDEQTFPSEEAGDRLVVVRSGRLFYMADARWAAPAEIMFTDALIEAFDAHGGGSRLMRRQGVASCSFRLGLEVDRFEVVGAPAGATPPKVIVSFHAVLVRARDGALLAEKTFEGSAVSEADTLSGIIPAYDQAFSRVAADLIYWVDSKVTQ
jgi:cholesterol transport system auxiliary component